MSQHNFDDLPVDPDLDPADPGQPSRTHHRRAPGAPGSGRFQPSILIAVAAGGVVGGFARHTLSLLVPASPAGWPWATLAANTAGTFLLAVLLVWATRRAPDRPWLRPLLGTGLLGTFTTFSAVVVQADTLAAGGRPGLSLTYTAVTLALGLAAASTGLRLADRSFSPAEAAS